MTEESVEEFTKRMMAIMGSLNPRITFLAGSRAQLHMAKVAGLPTSELTEGQQKIVADRIDEIFGQLGDLLDFLKSPDMINVLDKEILDAN